MNNFFARQLIDMRRFVVIAAKRRFLSKICDNLLQIDYLFFNKNRRICNYLIIKRLFGLLGNWVTRWQPFLFQSSLLFFTNDITFIVQMYINKIQ